MSESQKQRIAQLGFWAEHHLIAADWYDRNGYWMAAAQRFERAEKCAAEAFRIASA